MEKYIGTKIIEAEPMEKVDVINENGHTYPTSKAGYKVKYPDGYESWSPKDVFEKAYMKVIPNSSLKTDISISQEMVDNFIKEIHPQTIGEKTTLVRVVLVNGFEIVEASACVDKANYDEKIGAEICLEKIKDKIWFLLGFLLQTAINGIK
jgi:hypothetical protein